MAKRDKNGRFVKENPFDKNKNEIFYNLINSALAGGMVFLGTLADGHITLPEVLASMGAAGVIALIKFRDYWNGEKKEYSSKLFSWV